MDWKKKNWPSPVEAELHIKNELSSGGIAWKNSNRKNIKICCPHPHGDSYDRKFKCEITKDGRRVHCWVCDWSGSWNKLAGDLGLSSFDEDSIPGTFSSKVEEIPVFANLASQLKDAAEETAHVLPSPVYPWDKGPWRGLSQKFLSDLESFEWDHRSWEGEGRDRSLVTVKRIGWPYHQYGELVGYVGRRLDSVQEKKYWRASWCDAVDVLFPFDWVRSQHKDKSYVVLVEGEVDALNLLANDISCLSILGSNNWSDFKLDLLLSLGKPEVILLMDGDHAGRKACDALYSSLKNVCSVHAIELPEDEDPGSLDEDQIEWLKSSIKDL